MLEQRLVRFAHPPLPEALFGFLCLETSGLFCHRSKIDGLRTLIKDRLLLTMCVWIQAESSITRLLASEAGGGFYLAVPGYDQCGLTLLTGDIPPLPKRRLVRVLARVSVIRWNILFHIDIS